MLHSKRNMKFFTVLYMGHKPFKDHCIFRSEQNPMDAQLTFPLTLFQAGQQRCIFSHGPSFAISLHLLEASTQQVLARCCHRQSAATGLQRLPQQLGDRVDRFDGGSGCVGDATQFHHRAHQGIDF